ncbi:MAG: hypothetical protein AB7T63_01335 [Planctomycetota bacterium]
MSPIHALLAGCLLVGLVLLVSALQAVDPEPADPVVETGGGVAPEERPGVGPTLVSTSPPPPRSDATEQVLPDPTKLPPELAATHVMVQGRALYPDGSAAAGAEIVMLRLDGDRSESRAGEDGGFAFRVPRPAQAFGGAASLAARDEDGRSGSASVWVSPQPGALLEPTVLVLVPGASLDVLVLGPDGSGRAAEVFALAVMRDGQGPPVASGTSDASGRLRLLGLAAGHVRVVARGEGTGRGEASAQVKQGEPNTIRVELPEERRIRATVVAAEGGAPVAGARLHPVELRQGSGWMGFYAYLPALSVAPTQSDGTTWIGGLGPDDELVVLVEASGYQSIAGAQALSDPASPRVRAGQLSLRIPLQGVRRIRWPLTDADGPVPPQGTVVTLEPRPGAVQTTLPAQAVVEGEDLVGEGFGLGIVHALAHTPDGLVAPLFCLGGSTSGLATSFRPSRSVTVRCTHPDGAPATGLWVVLRNQGNNVLRPALQVDAGGVARFDGLLDGLVDVFLAEQPTSHGGERIGGVNLATHDGDFDVVVPRRRQALLRLTLDGKPGVPPDLRLHLLGAAPLRRDRGELADVDEALGTVLVAWRPAVTGSMQRWNVTARGYVATSVMLEDQGGDGPDVFDVPLVRGGTLELAIDLPADGLVRPYLERWDEDRAAWGIVLGSAWDESPPNSAALRRIEGLTPGRYRAADLTSCIASEAVDLGAGGVARVGLRLGSAGLARGRVVGPDGEPIPGVAVEVGGVDVNPMKGTSLAVTAYTNAEGEFEVRVPGERDVVLSPRHETYRPAAVGGTASVRLPRDGIVLRLERGGTFVLSFGRDIVLPRSMSGPSRVRVLLFASGGAQPLLESTVRVVETGITVGGFTPGTYDIWIDVPDAAPLALTGVRLTDQVVDLGTVPPRPGATVRLTLLVKEGDAPPRIALRALQEGPRGYSRGVTSRGEAVLALGGLGPGTFRVTTSAITMPTVPHLDQTIESDGEGVIEVTLDLR